MTKRGVTCTASGLDHRAPKALRLGFTLVELLSVIGIIGLLVALLLPAVQAAREQSRRMLCSNNLRQMALAALQHHQAHNVFPASWVNGDPAITWAKSLLPFIEESAIHDGFDPTISFVAGKNGELAASPISIYKCPTAPSPVVYEYEYPNYPLKYATIDYKGIQGADGSDPIVAHWGLSGWIPGVISRHPLPAKRIKDGLSRTILLVESIGGVKLYGPHRVQLQSPATIWYPTDGAWIGRALSSVSPTRGASRMNTPICTVNCSNMYDFGPYSFHPGGALVVLCDANVRLLSEQVDPLTLCALYAYDDGEAVLKFH